MISYEKLKNEFKQCGYAFTKETLIEKRKEIETWIVDERVKELDSEAYKCRCFFNLIDNQKNLPIYCNLSIMADRTAEIELMQEFVIWLNNMIDAFDKDPDNKPPKYSGEIKLYGKDIPVKDPSYVGWDVYKGIKYYVDEFSKSHLPMFVVMLGKNNAFVGYPDPDSSSNDCRSICAKDYIDSIFNDK